MNFRKRSHRRRLFNIFAFALLAFAIYLTVFYKDEAPQQSGQPTASTTGTANQ